MRERNTWFGGSSRVGGLRRWTSGLVVGVAMACGAGALAPALAEAHGIWGHIHVTAWAIENLPPGELRDFFEDPEVRNAAYFGAAFTDSGYWPNANEDAARTYGEHTHWEPFVEDYIQWMLANDAAPFESRESKLRVAFLIGAASHGLQDEIFDSYMLDFTYENDGGGQEETDPGTDGFLVLDDYTQVIPEPWLPMDVLLELYEGLDAGVTEDVIRGGVNTMMNVYVSEFGQKVAAGLGRSYASKIPWTRAHYMDPEIPGSLRSEIVPTAAYIGALWDRLNDRFDEDSLVIHAFPEASRRLLTGDSSSIGSVSMMIFGKGVEDTSLDAELVDDEGLPIEHSTLSNRWGGGAGKLTRLVRIRPEEDLAEGEWYTARLVPGLRLAGGAVTEATHSYRYQVRCDSDDDVRCPELDEVPPPIMRLPMEDEPNEEPPPPPTDEEDGAASSDGCAASASPGAVAWVWALAAAGCLVVRRRGARGRVRTRA